MFSLQVYTKNKIKILSSPMSAKKLQIPVIYNFVYTQKKKGLGQLSNLNKDLIKRKTLQSKKKKLLNII